MAASSPIAACDDPRRAVPLPGGRNFRDLGGYATADGRRVRWGRIYRSGSLAGVTPEGVEALRALGMRGLCDLRTTRERVSEPYPWVETLGLSCWARDYETSFAELRELLATDLATGEAARGAMIAGYGRLPYDQAPAYAELFRRIADGEVPLMFNCSAGKDRAGTGAALILTALGVPRETVVADYVLTDRFVDLEQALVGPRSGGTLGRQQSGVVRAILGCDPAYIATALGTVAPDPDAFARYLAESLGVDAAMLAAIHARMLESVDEGRPDAATIA
ncbi:MAG: tyrosine-protein phosphatase [Sphingomonas sp.]